MLVSSSNIFPLTYEPTYVADIEPVLLHEVSVPVVTAAEHRDSGAQLAAVRMLPVFLHS